MPQSRSRKHRRNRNKRPTPSKPTSPPPKDTTPLETPEQPQITEDSDGIIEAKVNGQAVKVTTEVNQTPLGHEIGSIPKQHTPVLRRRYKLERHALNSQPKIWEVTDVSDQRMEAHIGHVTGVGIVESSLTDSDGIRTIVTEPVEPLGPLPSNVTSKLETLGERDFAMALMPSNANRDRPEIHEVNDSDAEATELSRVAVVSEAESDIEIAPRKNETILEEETEESESTDKEENFAKFPKDQQKLSSPSNPSYQTFSSSSGVHKNADNLADNSNSSAVISEPESDIDLPTKSIMNEVILEETEEDSDFSDNQPSNTINQTPSLSYLSPPLLENSSLDTIDKDLASPQLLTRIKYSSSLSEDADSERTIIDSKGESETEGEQDNINPAQDELYNVIQESKESTKCTDDSNESTIDLKSKIFTGAASGVIETENGIQPTTEIHEPQLTRQSDDKLRIFIKECDLEKRQSDDNNLLNRKCHVNEFETCNSVICEHSEKVETRENYRYETSTVDRYLDIIQEESEGIVPHERDIRDFINQEIGKFCRERRKINVKDEVTETGNNEYDSYHEKIISSFSKNENIPHASERVSFDCNKINDVKATGSLANQVNEEELDSIKNRRCAPEPPKRSSSFNSMDVEKITRNGSILESEMNPPTILDDPPEIPSLPIEVVKILSQSPPARPSLPKIFNKNDIIPENIEHHHNEGASSIKLGSCNSEDVGKFGNDASVETLTKITHDHIDNISSKVLVENIEASKESTSMCDSTVSTKLEVKCSRPERYKHNDIKENTALGTLKRECVEKIEVKSSDIVREIKESCCEYNKSSVDVWTNVNGKCQIHEEIKSTEIKTEKNKKTETSKTSDKTESTETNENPSTDPSRLISLDDQESSSSTPSPATVKHISDEEQSSSKTPEPNQLKDLCIKRILSLPYGPQLINEITLPKFTIFKNLESIQKTVKTLKIHESKDLNLETMKKRPTTWMGVPTEDPRLLVCLSPSQQATQVPTSADKLLDLHKKFLNRHSYHHDNRTEINVPKYHIDITPTPSHPLESVKPCGKELKQLHRVLEPTNRLLEIVKENSMSMDLPSVTKSHKNVEQNPFKSTLVDNWLTQSNNDLNRPRYPENEETRESALSPVLPNDHITGNDIADIQAKRQGKIFDNITMESLSLASSAKFNDHTNRINSALILRTPEGESNQEHRSSTPINRSPITNRSAIIDRTSSDIAEPRKWTLSRTIDTRQVNPALINDRPEAPPRCRRTVDVDRTCIDTTSIFDKAPPQGHSTKYQDPVALKQATASEILDNLKHLQKDVKNMFDGRRRYSLPQEYFDRQLEYIETLEDQLKEVIIAEEEEKIALADLEGQVRKIENSDRDNKMDRKQLHRGDNKFRQTWHEESRISDNSHTELTRKEGHEESTKTVNKTPGGHVESSMKTSENKESCRMTSDSLRGQEWARYFDDISRDSVDAEKRDHYEAHGKLERPRSISILPTSDEVFRRRMYDEYVHKVYEREERKHHKVIKISSRMDLKDSERVQDNMSTMEKEFIEKARKRLNRFGIHLDESEQNEEVNDNKINGEFIETHKEERENNVEAKCLIDGKEIKDAKKLPKHLQEFLELTISELEDGVWSPGSEPPLLRRQASPDRGKNTDKDGEIPPVWTPSSAGPSPVVERKEFRPVSFESPILSRKNKPQAQSLNEEIPPWQQGEDKKEAAQNITQNITTRIVNSHSVPSQGLNTLASPPRLPRAQNPTITLLQKAREGQLPKGAAYLEETTEEKSHEGARVSPGEIRTRYGYGSASGYLSEPEPRVSADRSATLDTRRRQRNKENDVATSTLPRKSGLVNTTAEVYRNQPGRIENYQPGRSSISDKETKEWWDEVMDIFDGPFDQRNPHVAKPYMSHALKESGYESDSTLIFRRRDDASPLSPLEQRLAYKTVQKGGDVPLHGLRKPAPERPKESPRRYVEGEVTIHYRSPVRTEAKEILSEEELARRSAENMRRVYQEERRRKYLQELHDIDSRRHTDNFTPSQKSPIPLNRYDDFLDDSSYRSRSQEQTPEPRLVARALYNFVGQTSRELSFRRGDIILIRRQIDRNWYEGEHNAMIGLFPLNYVEILPYDGIRTTPKKSYEGQARAKFNFIAQTNLELSLAKGELVVLTRRVDENWFEGRVGSKKGIFPVTYVEVIVEPGQHRPETPVSGKPVASPAAHSMLSNGTASGKLSMGPHHYIPSIPVKTSTAEPQYISLPRIGVTERNKLHVAPVNETLHIDTHSDTLPYRALYNYRPQNEDELELREGDTVYVMEKCDDGWFVGSSQRTGYFGTFPGNYVERL